MEYVDITPTWEGILPTWLALYENAVIGDVDNPTTILANFKAEILSMARAADKWNAFVRTEANTPEGQTGLTDDVDKLLIDAGINEATRDRVQALIARGEAER